VHLKWGVKYYFVSTLNQRRDDIDALNKSIVLVQQAALSWVLVVDWIYTFFAICRTIIILEPHLLKDNCPHITP
jgi:hypothetical protein